MVFMDLQMPISNGYEACRQINGIYTRINSFAKEGRESSNKGQAPEDEQLGPKPILIACSALINE